MSWLERNTAAIRDAKPYARLVADESYGVPYLIQNLHDAKAPLIWLALDTHDQDDATRIGNKLSDAVNVAFGARMFGHGVPFDYGLEYLRSAGEDLSPFRLAISGVQHHPAFARECLDLSGLASVASLVLTMNRSVHELHAGVEPAVDLDASSLRLTREDAWQFVQRKSATIDVDLLLELSGGRYESFIALLRATLGEPPVIRPVPATARGIAANDAGNSARLVMNLRAMGYWQEAFEVAVDADPLRAEEIVTEAGDSFFETGQIERFLNLLTRLRNRKSASAKAMYWYFQASAACGKLETVRHEIATYLETSNAPQLRASFASMTRHRDALIEAERALQMERSPETLASVGFLKTVSGAISKGQDYMHDAYDLYVRYGRTHRAVQIANSIGASHVRSGDFSAGLYWGRWALGEIARRKVTEEVVRLSTVNLVAFTQLLIGELESGRTLLADANISDGRFHIPTLEGILSTRGDYELAQGNIDSAIQHYERLRDALPPNLIGYSTLHLSRALRHIGDFQRARDVTGQALELSERNSRDDAAMARLAHLAVGSHLGDVTDQDWQRLEHDPTIQANAPWLVETVLNRAHRALCSGNTQLAAHVIGGQSHLLRELGGDVWRLFLGNSEGIQQLQKFVYASTSIETSIVLLGQRDMIAKGQRTKLSLRYAELLTILADNDRGLSGEALLLEIYGDEGRLGTLKANLSRLRQSVPIESQPYRLNVPYKADFVEVERLIGEGKVREALELYKGPLLPESEAPGVCRIRERVDEAVRQAVLHAGEPDLLLRLAKKFPDDLELWERTQDVTPTSDPAYPLVRARIRRILGEWEL